MAQKAHQPQQPQHPQKQTQSDEQTCPNCGMAKAEWMGNGGNGFTLGDKTYCCQGCATGTGCTCR